ncbi:alanine racemase [Kitasatospora sp. NPDC097605]|uniref:alanine racemase n=1 Tax=Kitasatospora sp. NPDC097605 TaxID=3157226 RepID=UPI00332C1C54
MDREMPRDVHPSAQLPELRLDARALEHNIRLMAAWCHDHRVELAPHIKTTMTRPVVERQLAAGAWGVTVATVTQAGIALEWGARRVIIANQVVHPHDLSRLRRWLDEAPERELYCFVDSPAGIGFARSSTAGARTPLRVLVDVGTDGGRTGVKGPAEAAGLARAVRAAPGLLLAGVAGYEGVRPNLRDTATLAAVDEHCDRTVAVFRGLTPLFETTRPVFSMGGSAFPDRVVHALARAERHPDGLPTAVPVLRSGCYVTHDHGTYAHVSHLPGLKAALTVRAVVLSTPEPGRAVVGAGKRELPYDAGLPVLVSARDPHGARRPAAAATAERIYDHHLVLTEARDLHIGDEVDLGISHPCSAFDRWPDITVVDGQGHTGEVWHPRFR